jgi:hypothetical protein
MTAILGADGKLLFSKEVRDTGVLEQGARFDVTVSPQGDILLKRVRAYQKPSTGGEILELPRSGDAGGPSKS